MNSTYFSEEIFDLEKCIEIGLKQNPDYRVSAFQRDKSKNSYYNSFSPFIPSLRANFNASEHTTGPSSVTRIDLTTGRPIQSTKETSNYFSGGYSSGMTLFDVGQFFSIRASKAYYNSLKFNHQQNKLDLILSIKSKYYNTLANQKYLEISRESIDRAQKELDKINQKYDLGLVSQIDVIKQKGLLGQSILDSITYKKQYLQSLAELNEILGRSPDDQIELKDELDSSYIQLNYESLVQYGLENHPVLKNYQETTKLRKYQLLQNYSSYLPTVSLGFNHSWNNEKFDRISNFFDEDYSQRISLSFSWNLFDGFSREFSVKNSKIDYQIAKENIKKIELSFVKEIKIAYLSAIEAMEKIKVNQINLESAREDFRLAQEKYNLGAGSYLDLLDSQVSLKDNQIQLIYSLYQYKIKLAVIENTTSKDLD